MVSIIIPARNEKFLQKTINSLIEKARGEYEILVGLDGYWPSPALKNHPNVTIYHTSESVGMRQMINSLVRISKGEFIMKIDAHCNISKGFDVRLAAVCEKGMVCVPRQFSLHDETWTPNKRKRYIDHWYLSAPTIHLPEEERGSRNRGLVAQRWHERPDNGEILDETMCIQGSLWFTTKEHFYDMEIDDPNSLDNFSYEGVEMSLKTWLSGGKVVVVKNVWYAHLYKGKKHGRGYFMRKGSSGEAAEYCIKMFMDNNWPKAKHDMSEFIDRFAPVPTWENFDWSHEW